MSEEHVCPGWNCPFLVETVEGYVCSLSGMCMGTIMTVDANPNDGTQIVARKSNEGNDFVSMRCHDQNGAKMRILANFSSRDKNQDKISEDILRECEHVVRNLMKSESREALVLKKVQNAHREAIRKINTYLREENARRRSPSLALALLKGYITFTVCGGTSFRALSEILI